MNLTRQSLARAVANKCALPETETRVMVNSLFEHISDALIAGGNVKLSNFGSFNVHQSPKRIGRNPKTGEPAVITTRRRVAFKPSNNLIDRMKELK